MSIFFLLNLQLLPMRVSTITLMCYSFSHLNKNLLSKTAKITHLRYAKPGLGSQKCETEGPLTFTTSSWFENNNLSIHPSYTLELTGTGRKEQLECL